MNLPFLGCNLHDAFGTPVSNSAFFPRDSIGISGISVVEWCFMAKSAW